MLAARTNNTRMLQTLIQAKAQLNARDLNGRTALMWAVDSTARDSLEVLIESWGQGGFAEQGRKNSPDDGPQKKVMGPWQRL